MARSINAAWPVLMIERSHRPASISLSPRPAAKCYNLELQKMVDFLNQALALLNSLFFLEQRPFQALGYP